MHRDFFCYYHLPPEDIKQYVIIGNRFKLQPIIRFVNDNLHYYVLEVSYNGAQLFKGDLYNIKKLKFKKNPGPMLEELNIDELPHEQQFHSVAPTSQGKKSERSHGQYNETDVNKDLLLKYFRIIDRRLRNAIKNKKLPLILAGVEYLLPLYRKINTYKCLSDKDLRGNFEHTPSEKIQKLVCKMLTNNQINDKLNHIII